MKREPTEKTSTPPGLAGRLLVEALIGLIVAGLVLWAVVAAGAEIPFVYQGL